ncbi:unnamed protein product [Pleuronectes platessa]|uniref:Uncharacterized protein n=1 Tax=Pleuronectes platessa TaxID=8262 RepID=A0A9N7V3F7_PLEPL|nr:unnamed protein product [Pleuronectes platessa]
MKAPDGLCHPFPQAACLSAHLTDNTRHPRTMALTPTPATPPPLQKNPHTLKIIQSGPPLINMLDKSVRLTLLPLVSPAVGEEGADEGAGTVPSDSTLSSHEWCLFLSLPLVPPESEKEECTMLNLPNTGRKTLRPQTDVGSLRGSSFPPERNPFHEE